MTKVTSLAKYSDAHGNIIDCNATIPGDISITFKGKNNRIVVADKARVVKLSVTFDCDNGTLIIGSNTKVGGISMNIRVGQDGTVKIGDNVSTTSTCVVSAVEGATVSFGNDVMIATNNQFRADDGHPIFSVETGKRVNPARDITIGDHVWFAFGAVALGGATVGNGSVIGFGSLVTGRIPNNVVAVGSPAKVIRRHIAWERPHLSLVKPYYKPEVSSVSKSEEYWKLTEEDPGLATSRDPLLKRPRILLRRYRRTMSRLLQRTRTAALQSAHGRGGLPGVRKSTVPNSNADSLV